MLIMRDVKFYDGDIQLQRVRVFYVKTSEESEAHVKECVLYDSWYTDAEFAGKFDFDTKITGFLKL